MLSCYEYYFVLKLHQLENGTHHFYYIISKHCFSSQYQYKVTQNFQNVRPLLATVSFFALFVVCICEKWSCLTSTYFNWLFPAIVDQDFKSCFLSTFRDSLNLIIMATIVLAIYLAHISKWLIPGMYFLLTIF